jgi:hypothetical protein
MKKVSNFFPISKETFENQHCLTHFKSQSLEFRNSGISMILGAVHEARIQGQFLHNV